MSDKQRQRVLGFGGSEKIRTDLESRGMAPELSHPAARRLSAIAADLSPKEYGAVLDGVAAAYGQCEPSALDSIDSESSRTLGVAELERLMEGFTGELRKLEEGLQILSAYVVKMSTQSNRDPSKTLH